MNWKNRYADTKNLTRGTKVKYLGSKRGQTNEDIENIYKIKLGDIFTIQKRYKVGTDYIKYLLKETPLLLRDDEIEVLE